MNGLFIKNRIKLILGFLPLLACLLCFPQKKYGGFQAVVLAFYLLYGTV